MNQLVTFGDLPAVRIRTPQGAEVTIALFGAHLLSWKTADGVERLFMSTRSASDGKAALRGGVPVIFPQFSTRGPGQRHGLARLSTWRMHGTGIDDHSAWAEFALTQDDVPPALAQGWPHAFALCLRLTLHNDAITLDFKVRNSGNAAFDFAVALHTYFAVKDVETAVLSGLQQGVLHFGDALDTIHPGVPQLQLDTGRGRLALQQQGFSDWVVWNPGAEGAAALSDMADQEYRHFVCVEAARVDQQPLAAGAEWAGQHTISLIP
jgi:glucose-6-phosphate 1-epimerase